MPSKSIKFLHGGELVELSSVGPNETILDYLRLRQHLTGTKEGCGEGDCGACTVAIGQMQDDEHGSKVVYQPVNSCIQLLGSLDGKELVTVEDLAAPSGELHPVQTAMVENHGSQCGFCTPGFIMSLFVLHHEGKSQNRQQINDALAGNLCRCTGYRGIIDAAQQMCEQTPQQRPTGLYSLLNRSHDLFIGHEERFFASPTTLKALAQLRHDHQDAVLVAGATDVGLWITKQLRHLPKVIYLGNVTALKNISMSTTHLTIGAGVTYAQGLPHLEKIHTDLAQVVRRIGSKQVRAVGTIGGNIANGSPIGDMPPMLIALGAQVVLSSLKGERTLPLEDFYIEYGKQDLKPDEYLSAIHIPLLQPAQQFRAYKISKRFDQDISAVMAGFCFDIENDIVKSARCAYGGMAGTPMMAIKTQAGLIGLNVQDEPAWQQAAETLAQDFTPMSDMRASAQYRLTIAKALLLKARIEISGGVNTRVLSQRETYDEGATPHAQ